MSNDLLVAYREVISNPSIGFDECLASDHEQNNSDVQRKDAR
jgi:hypothetical protein